MTVSSAPRGEYTARPGAHPNPQEPHVDRIPLDHLTSDQLDQLYDRLEGAEAARDRLFRSRDRQAARAADLKKRADQAEDLLRVAHETSNRSEAERARMEQRVTELTAGQCTHTRRMCDLHHREPVADCPYPRCIAARTQEADL